MTAAPQPEQAKQKEVLRPLWRRKRREISESRRQEAIKAALPVVLSLSEKHRYVMSYVSFGDEFSTGEINWHFAEAGKLLLPKVDQIQLKIFHVNDPASQLSKSSWGMLEPIPDICQEADLEVISSVLVPGLAFDSQNHRLGYGKGFYDRFLFSLSPEVHSYGLGFKEQLQPEPLPTTPSDFPLTELMLF